MGRYEEVFEGRYDGRCQQIAEGKLAAYFRWQNMLQEQRFLSVFRWGDMEGRLMPVSQLGRAGNICC